VSEVPTVNPTSTGIENVPVLPLRDVVVYPHMVIPLFVGREKSIQALDVAMRTDKRIMLVAQKQADVDDPKAEDLYRIATLATVLQLLKLPDGTVKVLVEGQSRGRVLSYTDRTEYYEAEVEPIEDEIEKPVETEALSRSVVADFEN
jgi:ATP-dependent Lon protease